MNINDVLDNELTVRQKETVLDPAEEILCLACAGSGKSRTLAFRVGRLISEGVAPDSIVAFTFTEKAAETIKRRVSSALTLVDIDPTLMGKMYIGTIHAYCQEVLMQMDAVYRQYDVLDDNKLVLYLISRFYQLNLQTLADERGTRYFETIKKVADAWKTMNDELLELDQIVNEDPTLGNVLSRFRDGLDQEQFLDFSLMIRKVVDALREENPSAIDATDSLQHLLVDEYQDINPCQEVLISELHRRCRNLFVVGDDDQSIYAWRGADVSKILTFQTRFPDATRHTLSTNFRSTSPIVEASDAFVAAELGPGRITKNPVAHQDAQPQDFRVLWFDTREQEASWVADRIQALLGSSYSETDGIVRGLTPSDFAVLMRSTRTNEQNDAPRHRAFSDALNNRGIPYTLEAGGGPFERQQVQVLRSTFELLRPGAPTRETVRHHFDNEIFPAYPNSDFDSVVRVLATWGRLIHTPAGGARRRVYPQQLVFDLLKSFGLSSTDFDDATFRDIGLFSHMMQDVESVYMSVDSPGRFREILNFLSNTAESGYDISTEEAIKRPDAVTVATVHKMKGLEFPCVFIVDVESQRFPGRNRRYEGWLPNDLIQGALDRGAYHSTPEEEARLFYTALTRAERYLHVTGAANLPLGRRQRTRSRFANRLANPAISNEQGGLPPGITASTPRRRVEEANLPTSFSELRYYFRCPRDYRFRNSFGFSPSIPEMFGFGKSVHTAIEKLHESFPDAAPTEAQAGDITGEVFHLKHVPESNDPVGNPGPYERARNKAIEIAQQYVDTFTNDFERLRQVEVVFEIPASNCVIAGSIDLILKEDPNDRIIEAEIIDFKAVEGGEEPELNEEVDWTELALQIQLYARAAQQLLGENAKTGHVHFLKDNKRIEVPVTDEAVDTALANVDWAVEGILDLDFPRRPHPDKCKECDFTDICSKTPEGFNAARTEPPQLFVPAGRESIGAYRLFEEE